MSKPYDKTAKDIAAKYKVTPRHIQNLAKAGKVPHRKVGSDYRFNEAEVDDHFAGKEASK